MKKQQIEKILKQLEEAVLEEVGSEPEVLDLEKGDLRSSVWQAINVLKNFFK